MYRWRLSTEPEPYDKDRFGDWHDDRAAMREADPKGGADETHLCSMCGKDIEAQPDCAVCGDALDAMEDAA